MPVYTICGHGGEPIDSFIVPRGCTIVVKANPGCYMSKYEYNKHLRTIFCNKELQGALSEPVANISDLRKSFGPVSIFKEGDTCPNFLFRLLVDYPDNTTHIKHFSQMSGIIPVPTTASEYDIMCNVITGASDAWLKSKNILPNYVPALITNAKYSMYTSLMNKMPNSQRSQIQKMVEKLVEDENKGRKNQYNARVKSIKSGTVPINMDLSAKSILPVIYEHSIYPTKEEILSIVEASGENPSLQDVFMDGEFQEVINIDLKTLFTKLPGTYYHFACRLSEDPAISQELFTNNIFETNNGNLASRPIPAIYNRPVLEMPAEHQYYIKQAISEVERKKLLGKTRRNRQSRKSRRQHKYCNTQRSRK